MSESNLKQRLAAILAADATGYSRLMSLDEPGGITVSESIHTAVRGKVAAGFADQGKQSVKNIAYPVRAYSVSTRAASGAPVRPASSIRWTPDCAGVAGLINGGGQGAALTT